MKKLNRVLSLCLACAILLGVCLMESSASAANDNGLTFSAEDLYAPAKGLDQAPNTFEAWINLPTSASGSFSRILSNHSTGNHMVRFDVVSKGRPALYITGNEGKKTDFIFQNVNVCTGEWVHLAIVRDPVSQTLNCYVNGELKETMSIAGTVWEDEMIPYAPLCLGGDWHTDNANYFKGEIREVAVFSTTRTAAQIKSDMASPLGAEGLLTYYDLSGAKKGSDIADLSGNGYDITYRENRAWLKPEEKQPVSDYAYSFAVLGDMQGLNFEFPDNFSVPFKWLADNAESKKIKYVFGLGDITDASGADEWARAQEGYHLLDGKVDYSLVRGNHDKILHYNEAFPWTDFADTHTGSFDGTMLNTYRLFTVGKVKYLFLNLDFGPSDEVLAWASDICEQYPNHNVILSTHAYLHINEKPITENDHVPPIGNGGQNNGDHLWEKFVSKHENIVLVLCGHEAGNRIVMVQDKNKMGNTITQLLVNTSTLEEQSEEGLGMVAMLYFSEDGKNVQVEYYSTIKDEYFRSINQFSFELDLADKVSKVPGANAIEQGGNIYNGGTLNITGGEVYNGIANEGGNIYNAGTLNTVLGSVFGGIAHNGRNIYDANVDMLSGLGK